MTTLITGIAGFIGAHVARALLSRGETLVGIDNVNNYYDPVLKEARLKWIAEAGEIELRRADLADQPIRIFNHGDMQRDFTDVDDIVAGILAAYDKPVVDQAEAAPHRLYNIGNNHPEALLDMIAVLEKALGKKAIREFEPMQPGDVKATYADISLIERDLDYAPSTPIQRGIPNFVDWYREYHSR